MTHGAPLASPRFFSRTGLTGGPVQRSEAKEDADDGRTLQKGALIGNIGMTFWGIHYFIDLWTNPALQLRRSLQ